MSFSPSRQSVSQCVCLCCVPPAACMVVERTQGGFVAWPLGVLQMWSLTPLCALLPPVELVKRPSLPSAC